MNEHDPNGTGHKSFRLIRNDATSSAEQLLRKLAASAKALSATDVVRSAGTMFVWISTLFIATNFISPYLYICTLYGIETVWDNSLHVTDMPRHGDWQVSNGDMINNGGPTTYALSVASWFAMGLPILMLLHYLFPSRDPCDSPGQFRITESEDGHTFQIDADMNSKSTQN
jgi:hypothetical protein